MNEKFLTIQSNFNHEIIFNQIKIKCCCCWSVYVKKDDSLNWLTQPSKEKLLFCFVTATDTFSGYLKDQGNGCKSVNMIVRELNQYSTKNPKVT